MTNKKKKVRHYKKKYKVIYIDPPWPYRDKGKAGNRGASTKYDTMTMDELIQFPIYQFAAKDCALCMWVTDPMLPEALTLINAWGFIYKRILFTWIKLTKDHKKFKWGLGRWSRSNPEYVILAIIGRPKVKSHSVHSVVPTVPRGHSVKPDEVRKRIEKLFGNVPKIEIFARGRKHIKDGWSYLGDQA